MEGLPEAGGAQGTAGTPEVGETQERQVRSPMAPEIIGEAASGVVVVDENPPAAPAQELEEEDNQPASEAQKELPPREMAITILKGSVSLIEPRLQQSGLKDDTREILSDKIKVLNEHIATVSKMPESVLGIVLPQSTVELGDPAVRLTETLDKFRQGRWGYLDGPKAAVVQSGTVLPGGKSPDPISNDILANGFVNGGTYHDLPNGRWAMVVPKTTTSEK